jgi:CDP-diglyceride synthetase
VDDEQRIPSALPSRGARFLAFAAILTGGLCGGLIGFSITRLQCVGDCSTNKSLGGIVGAVLGAAGVAVVSVLALRAMGEWNTIQSKRSPVGSSSQVRNDRRRKPSA